MLISNSTGGLMLQTMMYLAQHTTGRAAGGNGQGDDTSPSSTDNDLKDAKCYGAYGCFSISAPWNTAARTGNVYPLPAADIQPRFLLYTRESANIIGPQEIKLNEPQNMRNLRLNSDCKIYMIIHGYLESGRKPWIHDMTQALLRKERDGEAAVIVLNWSGGSTPPYTQAIANIRLLGVITAHFINMLRQEWALPDLRAVHIIGHSLGAHLAGYAGHHLQQDFGMPLARITGLDPAAPFFTDTEPIVRLDAGDAQYVDIIHTDANPLRTGGLGMHQAIGHVDFYPNGGYDNPGCDQRLQDVMRNRTTNVFSTVTDILGCDHMRSYQYFIESIESATESASKCGFLAINCDSYENFLEVKCTQCAAPEHICLRMGINSVKDYEGQMAAAHAPLSMYLLTGERKPYCRWHYKVRVRIANHEESARHGGEIGTLALRLHGAAVGRNISRNGRRKLPAGELMKFSTKPMYFEPGLEYEALVPGHAVSRPKYVTVHWDYQTNLLNPLTWRFNAPRIFLEYLTIESLEDERVYMKLCPAQNGTLTAGSDNLLHERYCSP